eukprot:531973-Rhodomonas_salina.1
MLVRGVRYQAVVVASVWWWRTSTWCYAIGLGVPYAVSGTEGGAQAKQSLTAKEKELEKEKAEREQ